MSRPRLLVIMGSGETAPTMKAPHRSVFERLGDDVEAVMLDTPFGFQENAPTLASTTVKYFSDSVSQDVEVARLARTDTGDTAALESALNRIRSADWVFAGPGSPTFALRQWRDTPLRDLLAEKLQSGGALVFSSAAALTLGVSTIPVYEIYKAGMDPFWEPGLDLLSSIGIHAAVIPHYDNAEGGHHDTRFCYLGETRLARLEPELPDGAFVFGVDEHTGVILDLDADTAEVFGKGAVTLRRRDGGDTVNVLIEAGSSVSIDLIRSGGRSSGGQVTSAPSGVDELTDSSVAPSEASIDTDTDAGGADEAEVSLAGTAAMLERRFDAALAERDAAGAVAAVLDLESAIIEWAADTTQSDENDRARRALRSMIVRLGDAATDGVRDPRDVVGPVVEAALTARRTARDEKAYAVADAIRDNLVAAGVEVRDTPDGVDWHLT
ncbi:MAG: hypothetical protein AAGD33_10315 [Actinomycetota bacterium]